MAVVESLDTCKLQYDLERQDSSDTGESSDTGRIMQEMAELHRKVEQLETKNHVLRQDFDLFRLNSALRVAQEPPQASVAMFNMTVDDESDDEHEKMLAKHAPDLSDLAALQERLHSLDTTFSNICNQHAEEFASFKSSQDMHEMMLGKLASDLAALQELNSFKDMQDKNEMATLQDQYVLLPQRVMSLEQQLSDCADKHAVAVSELHGKVVQEKTVREVYCAFIRDLVARERERCSAHDERLNELERKSDRPDFLSRLAGLTSRNPAPTST